MVTTSTEENLSFLLKTLLMKIILFCTSAPYRTSFCLSFHQEDCPWNNCLLWKKLTKPGVCTCNRSARPTFAPRSTTKPFKKWRDLWCGLSFFIISRFSNATKHSDRQQMNVDRKREKPSSSKHNHSLFLVRWHRWPLHQDIDKVFNQKRKQRKSKREREY